MADPIFPRPINPTFIMSPPGQPSFSDSASGRKLYSVRLFGKNTNSIRRHGAGLFRNESAAQYVPKCALARCVRAPWLPVPRDTLLQWGRGAEPQSQLVPDARTG